jgi:regulator of nucleoside diphosphate kinase
MKEINIVITTSDYNKLMEYSNIKSGMSETDKDNLKKLKIELKRAKLMKPDIIPDDIVTMNSIVTLTDLSTGKDMEWRLVYPEYADPRSGRISILAPLGTAMLGYKSGDVFEWNVPKGKVKYKIKNIKYQPEADGRFDL